MGLQDGTAAKGACPEFDPGTHLVGGEHGLL